MSRAIVCICSPNKGSFANAITYLASSQETHDLKLVLLSDNYATAPDETFVDDTVEFLEELGRGEYAGKAISISPNATRRYRQAASILRHSSHHAERIYIRDFVSFLKNATKADGADRVIVDVTSLPKPLAAEVTITCLFLRLRVHSFELTVPFDKKHPENSMYHAVSAGGFRYPCLADPAVVKENMIKLTSRKAVRVSVLIVCGITVACFALLMWFKSESSVSVDLTLWIGLIAGVLGIGTGLLQLTGLKGLQ